MKLDANSCHGWLVAVGLLAAFSVLLASPTPQKPRYMTAELQAAIAKADAEEISSATNVAVFYVSITNTLVPPDFLKTDFNDAAKTFRSQAS